MRKFFLVSTVLLFVFAGTGCSSNLTKADSAVGLMGNLGKATQEIAKGHAAMRVNEVAIVAASGTGSELVLGQKKTMSNLHYLESIIVDYTKITVQKALEEKKEK